MEKNIKGALMCIYKYRVGKTECNSLYYGCNNMPAVKERKLSAIIGVMPRLKCV